MLINDAVSTTSAICVLLDLNPVLDPSGAELVRDREAYGCTRDPCYAAEDEPRTIVP